MSFILDALKKSEGERQRQTGPTIFEVKIAPPRNRLPVWAILIGALLAVNFGVVAWLLWRNSAEPDPTTATTSSVATQQLATPMGQPTNPPDSQYRAPAQAPFTPPAVARRSTIPELTRGEPEEPVLEEEDTEDSDAVNPEDYEPAAQRPPPQTRPPQSESTGVVRGTASGLPTYAEAKASGGNIPELRLDLHMYSPTPGKRFVFLNMQKVLEGQSMSDGVRVDAITPTGAELSFQGRKFVLLRD